MFIKKMLASFLLTIAIAPVAVVFLFFLLVVSVDFPFTSGVAARGKSSDGIEACIVQYYKNPAEPYQVSFYAKYPEGDWRWHYLAHESGRWRNTTIEFEKSNALIYKAKKLYRTIPVDKQSLTNEQVRNFPGEWDCQRLNREHKLKTMPDIVDFSMKRVFPKNRIYSAYLTNQNNTVCFQSLRELNFKRPAFLLAGDRTNNGSFNFTAS